MDNSISWLSVLAFHISESWKHFCYKAEIAESFPIRADLMLISLMLLGKLFSTSVSPIIYAMELHIFPLCEPGRFWK